MALLKRQKLDLSNGFINLNNSDTGANALIITALEGWDETPPLRRNTVANPFGHGLFYSRNATYAERTIQVRAFSEFPEDENITNAHTNFRLLAQSPQTQFPVAMTYYVNGAEVKKEILQCIIGTEFLSQWDVIENQVEMTFNLIAPDPFKVVYLNGSATPEENKRL